MRTTLDLDDQLVRTAKERAAREGTSLTRLLERALRQYLRPARRRATGFGLRLITNSSPPVPGVDFADRDALFERMEGRG